MRATTPARRALRSQYLALAVAIPAGLGACAPATTPPQEPLCGGVYSDSAGKGLDVFNAMLSAMGGDSWSEVAMLKWEYVESAHGAVTADVLHALDVGASVHSLEEWYRGALLRVTTDENLRSVQALTLGGDDATGDRTARSEAQLRLDSDAFPLIGPFLMRGATIKYDGAVSSAGDPDLYDVLDVTFPVGPPATAEASRYWIYVSQKSHLPVRWEYVSAEDAAKAVAGTSPVHTVVLWRGWEQVGPLLLSLRRSWPQTGREAHYDHAGATLKVNDALFGPKGNLEIAFLGPPASAPASAPSAR